MTIDDYVALLRERLSESYNVEVPWRFEGGLYVLYAHSKVVAGKYILHKKITYERMEVNEHVLVTRDSAPVTAEQVSSFVAELRKLVDRLVQPSDEHMSTALTGVIAAESGFTPDAARRLVRSGFTRNFWFGLRGWCFLRLIGVDLATGEVVANRRGKEVMKAYSPG
jgi:hypothetical protein